MSRSTTRGRWALALLGASLVWFYRRGVSAPPPAGRPPPAAPATPAGRGVPPPPRRGGGPPPAGATAPAGAEAAASRGAPPQFAWATAATIEPWVEGESFFPRIFADVEAAGSSVHILMFGWREGAVGTRMAELLRRKLAAGVEVRVLVDRLGSRPYGAARAMFTELAAAGAEIVVNDFSPVERIGPFPHGQRWACGDGGAGRVGR